jgi:hypothetical protein
MRAGNNAVDVLTKMLGRPLRTYRDAVHEMLGLSQ